MDKTVHKIWIIGELVPELPDDLFPTHLRILNAVFYQQIVKKKSYPGAITTVAEHLQGLWRNIGMNTITVASIRGRIQRDIKQYNALKKNKNSVENWQIENRKSFLDRLSHTMDITGGSIKELKEQTPKIENVNNDISIPIDETSMPVLRRKRPPAVVELESDSPDSDVSSSDESAGDDGMDLNFDQTLSKFHAKKFKNCEIVAQSSLQHLMTSPDTTSTLDRIKVSDRKFVRILGSFARTNHENIDSLNISRSSVRRQRQKNRDKIQKTIRDEFKVPSNSVLTVHWDGKLMNDATNQKEQNSSKCDRLGVIVSGHNVEKILGIPKIPAGTGQMQADEVFRLLSDWDLVQNISAMSFDTTASNTGVRNGACFLLEKAIGRNLLNLACRHHVHELLVKGTFESLIGKSTGPEPPLFTKFRLSWESIDKSSYQALEDERLMLPFMKNLKQQTISFLQELLSKNDNNVFPRDDYREMAELCLLILGVRPPRSFQFKVCGPCHHARWMAKVIFCFKIYLFRYVTLLL
jgi:hypothetical protein